MGKKNPTRRKKKGHKKRLVDWNSHHLLYQDKHWQQGYAKLLREHPYLRKAIPRDTLHAEIHAKIHDIPTPPGRVCKRTYLELLRREEAGIIDVKRDSLEDRLDFLIEMWIGICPATVEMLKWQRQLVRKFYNKDTKPKKPSTPPPA